MEQLHRKIESPCKIEWNLMIEGNQADRRFCRICSKHVFDISSMNDNEIEKLYFQEGRNICVKSLSYQLDNQKKKKNPFKALWRKGKFVGLILLASLVSQELSAQQKKKEPDSYHIFQEALNSDTITVKGVIKGERFIGWKKLKNAAINIWSEENVNLGNFQTGKDGKFEFRIDRKIVGDCFSISISALDYRRIKVENLEPKDTKIEVFLEEQETVIVTGRYF